MILMSRFWFLFGWKTVFPWEGERRVPVL